MRFKIHISLMLSFFILFSAPISLRSQSGKDVSETQKAPTKKGPSVFLPLNKYEFPSVLEGEDIVYNFVIQNKGSEPLKIEKITTSCGCTVAFFDEEEENSFLEDIFSDEEEIAQADISSVSDETVKGDGSADAEKITEGEKTAEGERPTSDEKTAEGDNLTGGKKTAKGDSLAGDKKTVRGDNLTSGKKTAKGDGPGNDKKTAIRVIQPGDEDIVMVKVNTKGRWGRLVKTATIYTNDKENSRIKLTMRGDVERFATLVPGRVKLDGSLGNPIIRVVSIIDREEYPFKILDVRAEKEKNIRFKLDEIKKAPDESEKTSAEKTSDEAEKTSDESEKASSDEAGKTSDESEKASSDEAGKISDESEKVSSDEAAGKTSDEAEKAPSDEAEKVSDGSERNEYLLTVENTMKKSGRYYDIIILKTDSEIKPEIKISVSGNIFESGK